MSTPITSRRLSYLKSTSSAVLSPQTRRSTTGLSIGSVNSFNESPQLPIVLNEDDARERREKRKSRSLAQTTSSSRIVVEDAQGETAKLTNDQLASHYINCIKLSTENKITTKNAFNLHLIDHMNEMLKQRCEGSLNFQMAGGTIFASAKIYASRVDAVHTEAYKVLSSLGRGSDNDAEEEDAEAESEKEKEVGKKKKKRSKILENNSTSLRFKSLEASFPIDPLDHYYSSLFDVARINGMLVNHVDMFDDGITLRFDSNHEPTHSHNIVGGLKKTLSSDPDEEDAEDPSKKHNKELDDFLFDELAKIARSKDTNEKMICPTFANFDWNDDAWTDERISEKDMCSVEPQATILSGDEDDMELDVEMDALSNGMEESVFDDEPKQEFNDPNATLQGAMEPELLTSFKPGEYSYFKPGTFSTWEGPNHWKMRRAPTSAANTETSAGSGQAKKGKKRKRNFYVDFAKREVDEIEFKNSRKAKEVTKRILDKWNKSMEDRLLPDAGEYNVLDLAKCVLQEEVQIRPVTLIRSNIQEGVSQIHSDGFPVYNYDNPNDRNNYCPVLSDNEEEENVDDGPDIDELPPDFTNCDYNGTMDRFPDMTLSQSQSINENSQMNFMHYDSLVKGDLLISQPRKVEKIPIAYAKKSTRIDVRRLKSAMWTLLQNNKIPEAGARSPQDTGVQDDEDDPADDGSGDARQTEGQLFSNLYSILPRLIPNQMTENLSVPLAFNCLLHLANEKNLKIESSTDMSDLMILNTSFGQ